MERLKRSKQTFSSRCAGRHSGALRSIACTCLRPLLLVLVLPAGDITRLDSRDLQAVECHRIGKVWDRGPISPPEFFEPFGDSTERMKFILFLLLKD